MKILDGNSVFFMVFDPDNKEAADSLAKKMVGKKRNGEVVPLTPDEMAILRDCVVISCAEKKEVRDEEDIVWELNHG
jgi:hypothetical protein